MEGTSVGDWEIQFVLTLLGKPNHYKLNLFKQKLCVYPYEWINSAGLLKLSVLRIHLDGHIVLVTHI